MSKIYDCLIEYESGYCRTSRVYFGNNELMFDDNLKKILEKFKGTEIYNNLIKSIHSYVDDDTIKNRTFVIGKYEIKF